MRTFGDLREELNKNKGDFLRIDLDTAFTLTRIADGAGAGTVKRKRNVRHARKAYDTIVKLRTTYAGTAAECLQIDKKIRKLRRELLRLGESFG